MASIAGNLTATLLHTGRLTSEPDQAMVLNAVDAGLEARAFLDATVQAHLGGIQITAANDGARTRLAVADSGGKGTVEIAGDVILNLEKMKMAPSIAAGEHLGLAACVCPDGVLFAVPGNTGCTAWVANNQASYAALCP